MSDPVTLPFSIAGKHAGALRVEQSSDGRHHVEIVGWDVEVVGKAYEEAIGIKNAPADQVGRDFAGRLPGHPRYGKAVIAEEVPALAPSPVYATGPHGAKTTTSGRPPEPGHENARAPGPIGADGQHTDHWALADEDRQKGFVRPLRFVYTHLRCETDTRCPQKVAETYAARPTFYASTFCCHCKDYFPVGSTGEFCWKGTNVKVGT